MEDKQELNENEVIGAEPENREEASAEEHEKEVSGGEPAGPEGETGTKETAGDSETASDEDIDAEASGAEDAETPVEETGEEKKGFFKKNKKKDKLQEKVEELTDQVKRQMAEFDNFRKRTEKEKTQMYEVGAKSIIEKVLPVVDNFERGLAAVPQDQAEDAFVDGMNMIYKQLMTVLEDVGVTPIEAVGKEFDPNLHNAVMQVESEEYGSGIVAQEMQKGYMYRDSVVRHSMVAVVS